MIENSDFQSAQRSRFIYDDQNHLWSTATTEHRTEHCTKNFTHCIQYHIVIDHDTGSNHHIAKGFDGEILCRGVGNVAKS